MRGIIYTNLINIIFHSPFSVSFHSPLPSCSMGPSFPFIPKMHLSKLSTCCCAIKTRPSGGCFNRATSLCYASAATPQRATDIPTGWKNLRQWLLLAKTTPFNFLPCVNLILLLRISTVPQAGRDWLNDGCPFNTSIQGNSYSMCFDYGVMYKREGRERPVTEQGELQREFN